MSSRKSPIASAAAVAAVVGLAFALASLPVSAQRGRRGGGAPAAPSGPVPRLSDGKPDLSGLWQNPYFPDMARRGSLVDPQTRQPLTFARQGDPVEGSKVEGRTFDLPFTDWGLQQWRDYDPANDGDYAGNCLPFGMSRNINSPHGLQIIHSPTALAFLFEQNTWFHWVPTTPDFEWPEDLPPSWNGLSKGHWEGDTLVIETDGFNGYSRLDTTGHPHSTQLVLTNSFTRTGLDTIEHTVTVHDPVAYTQDWMNLRTWRLRSYPDVIMEYSCEENNLPNILSGAIKVWQVPDDVR